MLSIIESYIKHQLVISKMPSFRIKQKDKVFTLTLNRGYTSFDAAVEFYGNWLLSYVSQNANKYKYVLDKKQNEEVRSKMTFFAQLKVLQELKYNKITIKILDFIKDENILPHKKTVMYMNQYLRLGKNIGSKYTSILESCGVIERKENPNDKRELFLSLLKNIDEVIDEKEQYLNKWFKKNKPF